MPGSAQCVTDAGSEGNRYERGSSAAAANFDNRFSRSFSERCALPTNCGYAKGLGWPCWPVSSPTFVWAVLGLSSLSVKKSSAYHNCGSARDGRRMPTHRAEQHESIAAMPWFTVSHFQSKIGTAIAILCRLSGTRTMQKGTFTFWRSVRQQGLPGWAGASGYGHHLGTVRRRANLR